MIAVLAVLVAVLGGALVARALLVSPVAEVSREPVGTAGANPFMPSVGTDALDVRPVAHSGGYHSGGTPGLYGGSGSDAVCDRTQLSRYLGQHPDKGAAWAAVLGLPDAAEIAGYVEGLTPVVLRSDTLVTNHGWSAGAVTAYPAVLQAGTAVLVDAWGRPVTRCLCGNPLTVPMSYSTVSYVGPTWVSFSSTEVTVIQQNTTVTQQYTLVDVHDGEAVARPVGTDGDDDEDVPSTVTDPLAASSPTAGPGVDQVTVPGSIDPVTGAGSPGITGSSGDPSTTPSSTESTAPDSSTTESSTTDGTAPVAVTGSWTPAADCTGLGTADIVVDTVTGTYRSGGVDAGTAALDGTTLTLTPDAGGPPLTYTVDGTGAATTLTPQDATTCTLTSATS